MKRVLAYICIFSLTISWMALIYGFSAQDATESGGLSAVIAEPVTQMIMKLRDLPAEEYDALYMQVDSIIRVMAHFTEYAILGILMTVLCRMLYWKGLWIPWVICTVFAVTDEWHQSYSPGRTAEVKDVVIDSAGVICGIILLLMLRKVWRSRNRRYNQA